jgi:hypothetical protein
VNRELLCGRLSAVLAIKEAEIRLPLASTHVLPLPKLEISNVHGVLLASRSADCFVGRIRDPSYEGIVSRYAEMKGATADVVGVRVLRASTAMAHEGGSGCDHREPDSLLAWGTGTARPDGRMERNAQNEKTEM